MNADNNGNYEVLNPRGVEIVKENARLSGRLSDLKGKVVHLVDIGKSQSDELFEELERYLRELAPDTKFVQKRKKTTFFDDEPDLWDDVEKNADAFILGAFD